MWFIFFYDLFENFSKQKKKQKKPAKHKSYIILFNCDF